MIRLFALSNRRENTRAPNATTVQKRIQKDICNLSACPAWEVYISDPNDLHNFDVMINPSDGFYKDTKTVFKFFVGPNYPQEPPRVKCITPIYHPNIDDKGHVCLNILSDDWNTSLSIHSVIVGLLLLLLEPNPHDALNKDAGEKLSSNPDDYKFKVSMATKGLVADGNGIYFQYKNKGLLLKHKKKKFLGLPRN